MTVTWFGLALDGLSWLGLHSIWFVCLGLSWFGHLLT